MFPVYREPHKYNTDKPGFQGVIMNEKRKTEIFAYGKINFSIDAAPREGVRGYHDVRMIMRTIPIYDIVTITSEDKKGSGFVKIYFTCSDKNLPVDSRNIAVRAANLMLDKHPEISEKTDEISINVVKNIPVGGGLGGSSADGAGVLKGMNAHFGLGLSTETLMEYGAELGSDVPFQVKGGMGLAEGRGTEITELPDIAKGFILVCMPEFSMYTREVYDRLDIVNVPEDAKPDTDLLIQALKDGDLQKFYANLKNVLEIPACNIQTGIKTLKDKLLKTNPAACLMSGSGASVYGIYTREANARNAATAMQMEGYDTFICDISRRY